MQYTAKKTKNLFRTSIALLMGLFLATAALIAMAGSVAAGGLSTGGDDTSVAGSDGDKISADSPTNDLSDDMSISEPISDVDTSPPTFAGIKDAVDDATGGSVTLSWDAAEDKSTPITYNIYQATTSGGQDLATPTYTTTDLSYQVTGLTDGTTYYYVVRAEDSAGNEETNTIELNVTPTTATTTPTITSVEHDATGTLAPYDTLTVTLKGDEGLTATFDIGTVVAGVSMTEGTGVNKGTYTGDYTIKTSDTSGTYNVTGYLDSGTGVASMDADTQVTIDTTPPTISDVQSSPTTTSATITWTTDEASDSLVEYGTTSGGYSDSVSNTTLVTSHSIELTGLDAGITYYYRVTSRDAVGNQESSPEYNFSTTITILLVDDDDGASHETYYQSALAAGGYTYDDWDVNNAGSPSATTLGSYDVVIWFTADDYKANAAQDGTLTSTDRSNLETYLAGGGKLFITGQDIGYDANSNSWLAWYEANLHASYVADSASTKAISGIAGDPIGDGISDSLNALYTLYPDVIDPADATATNSFEYSGQNAGIRVDTGTYLVVYFAFAFETMSTESDRNTVMDRVIKWLALPPDTTPPTFDGIQYVNDTVYQGTLELDWNAASDPSTPITYNIYQATTSGGQDFTTPTYTTRNLNYRVSGLTNGQTYYFVVRAEDYLGNEETNTVEKSGTPTGTEDPAKKYAVIVGISDYKAISDLSYCDEDASDWYYYLTGSKQSSSASEPDFANAIGAPYDEVWVYGDTHTTNYPKYDGDATEYNVKQALEYMVSIANAADTLVFATSGHGDGDGLGESYLCMWDSGSGESGEDGNLYDHELAAIFETSSAGRNFVFVDHCYAGGMGDDLMVMANSDTFYVTTACNEAGYGYDDPGSDNGLFTEWFLNKGLRNGESGCLDMEGNFAWVAANYPKSGNDAPCEYDGDTGALFYLE